MLQLHNKKDGSFNMECQEKDIETYLDKNANETIE